MAKAERRPLAGLCVHLIEEALQMPRFREILKTESRADEDVVKSMGLDQLDADRIQELQSLLNGIAQMKKRQQD